MSEEQEEGASSGTEPQAASAGPAAIAMALGSASRAKADAFLEKQARLSDLQIARLEAQDQHFHEEAELELTHLRWRAFTDRMKGALQIMGVLLGVAVVGGLGVMIWEAAHSEGYVIESFTVPPDLAARGLSGEVAASRLLDRLNVILTPSPNSVAAAQSASTSAADDVRVEIPETGISIGELYRFLRRWLGHENHVGGEVVRQGADLAVAVRINGRDGAVYQGPEADLDTLLQKAAEHVADIVQPNTYANWFNTQTPPREAEARAILQRVIADTAATPVLRASSLLLLGNMAAAAGDLSEAIMLYRRSQETNPDLSLAYSNTLNTEVQLSHPEAALALQPRALAMFEKYHDNFTPAAVISVGARMRVREPELHGDYARAVSDLAPAMRGTFQTYQAIDLTAIDRARLHDGAAPGWLAEQPMPASTPPLARTVPPIQIAAALQHWPRVIALAAESEKVLADNRFSPTGRETIAAAQIRPWLALAKARTGDIAGAETLIAATPGDCYDCGRGRGLIASEAKQWGRADYWFAKAVADAPSIPFAHEDWGRSLLARGKADEAIAQFTLANQKGPHFADALEGWGEALMAKSQSHLALAKFAEAEKYAPNWGRLHLKWGEALVYAGKKGEAKAQFARAAELDLTPSEKAELARAQKM